MNGMILRDLLIVTRLSMNGMMLTDLCSVTSLSMNGMMLTDQFTAISLSMTPTNLSTVDCHQSVSDVECFSFVFSS